MTDGGFHNSPGSRRTPLLSSRPSKAPWCLIVKGLHRDNGKENESYYLGFRAQGHGDLAIVRITRVTLWVLGVMNLLTKSPCPSK